MLTHKAFEFSAEGKSLDAAISRINQGISVGAGSPVMILASVKKKVKLIGMVQDAFVMLDLPNATAQSDGCFAFTAQDLQGVVKGRPVLDFKYNGNEISWSKARYSGSLATIKITEDQDNTIQKFLDEEDGAITQLPGKAIVALQSAIAASSINDVVGDTKMLSYVVLDKSGKLSVSSFTIQHFSIVEVDAGCLGCEFKIALPQVYFAIIKTISDGQDSKFYFSKASIKVVGKGFNLVMPSTQSEDHHFSMVKTFVEALGKPTYTAKFSPGDLKSIIGNLFTLFKTSSFFEFTAKAKSQAIAVKLSTTTGSAADEFEVRSKSKEAMRSVVDPRLFSDILRLVTSIPTIEFAVTPKVVYLRGESARKEHIFVACAQHKENK